LGKWFLVCGIFGLKPPEWVEFFWIGEHSWVAGDSPFQGVYNTSFGDEVTVVFVILGKKVGNS